MNVLGQLLTFLSDLLSCSSQLNQCRCAYTHTHTHTRLTALFPGLPGWAGTREVKPIWILLKQDSDWQWHQLGYMQLCTSLQTDNHASTPPLSFFTGRMPFLPPNQQRQGTLRHWRHTVHTVVLLGKMKWWWRLHVTNTRCEGKCCFDPTHHQHIYKYDHNEKRARQTIL